MVQKTLKSLLDAPLQNRAIANFVAFREQIDEFATDQECWNHQADPRYFWYLAKSQGAGTLATVALRLIKTLANSVPSERAFSTMKLVHSLVRNKLDARRVEKICFIHINRRIIDQRRPTIYKLKEEKELLELEADLQETIDLDQHQAVDIDDDDSSDDDQEEAQISKEQTAKRTYAQAFPPHLQATATLGGSSFPPPPSGIFRAD